MGRYYTIGGGGIKEIISYPHSVRLVFICYQLAGKKKKKGLERADIRHLDTTLPPSYSRWSLRLSKNQNH